MNAWPPSRWRTSTTCAGRGAMRSGGDTGPRPTGTAHRSRNAGRPRPTGVLALSASTVGTRGGAHHIPQRFAAEVNAFCREFLNPYVNFHRPCFFAESITDAKGKTRKRYLLKDMMTPYEKLKSLPDAMRFLKPGTTFEQLDQTAAAMSDNAAAERLNAARKKLFQSINRRSKHAA